jgi:RHS repeat-associated protein
MPSSLPVSNPPRSRRLLRVALALLPVAVLALAAPRPAAAQCSPADAECQAGQPPIVWIVPDDSAWSATSQPAVVPVTIHWCGPYSGLDQGSIAIYLDGDSLTDFTWQNFGTQQLGTQHCLQYATSSKTLTLAPGTHQLYARIARFNDASIVGQATVTYAFTYQPPPTYGVAVSPHTGSVQRPLGAGATEVFQVTNAGNVPATFAITATCAGSAPVGCSTSATSLTLAPLATASVGVNYHAGVTSGLTGSVRLRAVSAQAADSGTVSVATVNNGKSGLANPIQANGIIRSDCLTVAVGEAAAYECGDLRLAHTFPGVRVMNRAWAPALVYNSQQARPYPVIQHSYAPPAGSTPSTVTMQVCSSDTPTWCWGTSTYPGWAPGESRRAAVSWDAALAVTGVYPYVVTITSHYANGTSSAPTTITGKLVIVNRGGLTGLYRWPLGWSMAGVEQLFPISNGGFLWVAGDGSAQIYDRIDASTWVALPYDRPDTLRLVSGEYVRTLPGRAEVRFDGSGRHVRTINKLGHQTTLTWSGDQLAAITLPHGLSYTFTYTSCGGQLNGVTAPGGRFTSLSTDCPGRLLSVTNPGLPAVSFGYADATSRIASRTDRRGFRTDFRYDAAFRLSAAKRWMTAPAAGDSIVTRFRAQESQGLPGLGGAILPAQLYTRMDGPRLDVPDTTRFAINRWGGPSQVVDALGRTTTVHREDGRWPALVTRVVYPNGREVTATYDARGHPVATVDWANPLGGRYATTLYAWDSYWDAPTRVTQPEGEFTLTSYDAFGRPQWIQPGPDSARRVRFTYHPNNHPNAPGLVQSVREPLTNPETYAYDWLGNGSMVTAPTGLQTMTASDSIGRVRSVTQPGGASKTLTYDAADRVIEEHSYGPPRVAHSSFTGDSTYTAEHLWVRTYPNANGQPDSIARWQQPDPADIDTIVTRWKYDGAGRSIVEIAPDGTRLSLADNPRDSTVYDPAGNVIAVFTRRGHNILMQYDTLNRLVRRIIPGDSSIIYGTTLAWANPATIVFPRYGQDSQFNFTGSPPAQSRWVKIPGDTATFGYDEMGNTLWANNRDARVFRTWNANGTMASETQRIRTYAGTDTLTHAYRLDYRYDLDGRRTGLIHPGSISPHAPTRDSTGYRYDPVTGALASVTGLGNYGFTYDATGRTSQLTRGTTREEFDFDLGGRMIGRSEWSGNILIHDDSHSFDPVTGEPIRVESLRETVLQARRGLGALAWVDRYDVLKGTRNVEDFATDPLTNQTRMQMEAFGSERATASLAEPQKEVRGYERYTGRLLSTSSVDAPGPFEYSTYDRAGNQIVRQSIQTVATPYTGTISGGATTSNVPAPLRDEMAMYYDADGRLRVADRQSCLYFHQTGTTWACDVNRAPAYEKRSAFEEYRYDALGRRVLVRTRSEFACTQYCLNTLRRIVWDGDQVLYEISAPGSSMATAAQMEADTGLAVPFFLNQQHTAVEGFFPYGRVMYEHGGGIDAPLGVVRMDYSSELRDPQVIVPHNDWRGTYDRGTTIMGSCAVYSSSGTQLAPPPDSTPANPDQYGGVAGGGSYGGTKTHCIDVDWPASYTWSARQYRRGYAGANSWMGSLIFESRDASGLYYRRNRYYDSEKGRFTQEDPIGLAGGVNLYGFAYGDPTIFADPFGLCPDSLRTASGTCPGGLSDKEYRFIEKGVQGNLRSQGDGRILERLQTGRIVKSPMTWTNEPAEPGRDYDTIIVTDRFFAENRPEEGIWVLGHETGHILQWASGMLVREIGAPGAQKNLARMTRYMTAAKGTADYNTLQDDADWYACALVIAPGRWGDQC